MPEIDSIHKTMLDSIDNSYQKTIGYATYDITRAMAITAQALYQFAKEIADILDVDNLTGDLLTRFVLQRKGIVRKSATYATCFLRVTGAGTVNKGDLFESIGGVQFKAIETTSINGEGFVTVESVLPGTVGNIGSESITKIPVTITGIISCSNESPANGGYEEESDESLRTRYYEALQQPATSGNIYHYKKWAKEVEGVGDAKVFSLWKGDNTVQVVIIDANKEPAQAELVAKVQEHIDPDSKGTGEGEAPIGAYCTVTSAEPLSINISAGVKLLDGHNLPIVIENIKNSIVSYLQESAFQQDYISYAKVSNAIYAAEGIEDFSDMTLNQGTGNISIPEKSVAVLGEVQIIEQ